MLHREATRLIPLIIQTTKQLYLLHDDSSSLYLVDGPSASDYGDILEAMELDLQDNTDSVEDLKLSDEPCLLSVSDDRQSVFCRLT